MTADPEPELREALLAAVPSLRAFAISLSGQVDRADDLVQDTILRALSNLHRFERGTNLNAWLFTILRNLVGASGFSYEEAASICGCAVGTIKSRVNRARFRLAALLNVDDIEDLGPDSMTRAALQG
jgi:RNA polymerase sigma-70 factor (ECF subfamily)